MSALGSRGCAPGILWGEPRLAATRPGMQGQAPTAEDYLIPNVRSEKPGSAPACSSGLLSTFLFVPVELTLRVLASAFPSARGLVSSLPPRRPVSQSSSVSCSAHPPPLHLLTAPLMLCLLRLGRAPSEGRGFPPGLLAGTTPVSGTDGTCLGHSPSGGSVNAGAAASGARSHTGTVLRTVLQSCGHPTRKSDSLFGGPF